MIGQFEPYAIAAFALLQNLRHAGDQVGRLVFLQAQVGVAGDAKRGGLGDVLPGKKRLTKWATHPRLKQSCTHPRYGQKSRHAAARAITAKR